jgi:hypothetical protein
VDDKEVDDKEADDEEVDNKLSGLSNDEASYIDEDINIGDVTVLIK